MPLTIIQSPPDFPQVEAGSGRGLQHLRRVTAELPTLQLMAVERVTLECEDIPRRFADYFGVQEMRSTTTTHNQPPSPVGTLYICTNALYWFQQQRPGGEEEGKGFAIDYPSIILHATQHHEPTLMNEGSCIYLQLKLDSMLTADGDTVPLISADGEDATEEVDGLEPVSQIYLRPDDGNLVNEMYQALNECAALHPDAEMGIFDDDDDDGSSNFGGNSESCTSDDDDDWIRPSNQDSPSQQPPAPSSSRTMEAPEPSIR